jgi:3-polyprenyl-4-hydroxybenzoate decarboxylase
MAKPAFKAKTRTYFRDLRDFISLLEETGNLHRISARIEKKQRADAVSKVAISGAAG